MICFYLPVVITPSAGTRRAAGADRQAGIKCFLAADWWWGRRRRRRNIWGSECILPSLHDAFIYIHRCKKPRFKHNSLIYPLLFIRLQCGTLFPLPLLFFCVSTLRCPTRISRVCRGKPKEHRVAFTVLKPLQFGGFQDGCMKLFQPKTSVEQLQYEFRVAVVVVVVRWCCVSSFTPVGGLLSDLRSALRHKWKTQHTDKTGSECNRTDLQPFRGGEEL